jgi:hypothetical protein
VCGGRGFGNCKKGYRYLTITVQAWGWVGGAMNDSSIIQMQLLAASKHFTADESGWGGKLKNLANIFLLE